MLQMEVKQNSMHQMVNLLVFMHLMEAKQNCMRQMVNPLVSEHQMIVQLLLKKKW